MLSKNSRRTRRHVFAALVATAASSSIFAAPPDLSAQATTLTPAAKFVDSARVEIDSAVANNDSPRLDRAVVLLDRALTAFPKDAYLMHYRGYANYRRVVDLFRAGQMQKAASLIGSGIADLEQSSGKLRWAETYSLLSSLQAFRIALDPSLGQEIGMEIGRLTSEAVKISPNNPRVLLLQAYGAQNTPPEYGGGVAQARVLVDRAIAAFEADKPGPLAPNWGRAEAVALKKVLSGGPL